MKRKVAVVTGAGRGIGRSIALAFANKGISLLLNSRTLSELESVAEECEKLGSVTEIVVSDVSSYEGCLQIFNHSLSMDNHINILVNNAGVYGPLGSVDEVTPEQWTKAIATNLFSTFYMTNLVLPGMKNQGYGKIINLSGGGATNALPNFSAYAASKAAIARLGIFGK